MLDVFKDAAEGILEQLGEDAFFAGATVKINIEHGVQLSGIGGEDAQYRGDMVVNRDVASIHERYNPKVGQSFTLGGSTYRLDVSVEDNGALRRFVILKV